MTDKTFYAVEKYFDGYDTTPIRFFDVVWEAFDAEIESSLPFYDETKSDYGLSRYLGACRNDEELLALAIKCAEGDDKYIYDSAEKAEYHAQRLNYEMGLKNEHN